MLAEIKHRKSQYSSINPLGYAVDDELLISNNEFTVHPQRGELANITEVSKRRFRIEGSVNISEFLKRVIPNTVGEIEGSFDNASEAIITLEKPFTLQHLSYIPISNCQDSKIIAFAALNTGDININILNNKKLILLQHSM